MRRSRPRSCAFYGISATITWPRALRKIRSPISGICRREAHMTTTKPFLSDVQELRRRARENMMQGSVTSDYKGDIKQAVAVLNAALATEIVCVLRYKRHYYMAKGIAKDSVADIGYMPEGGSYDDH